MSTRAMAAALLAATALTSHALAQPATPAPTISPAAATAVVDFELFLPLRGKANLEALIAAQQAPGSASYHHWLSPAQFSAQFGPTAASLAKVRAAVAAAGLTVTATHTRSLHVSGTVAKASAFLGANLNVVTLRGGAPHLVADKDFALPAAVQAEGGLVPAFSGLPPARPLALRRSAPISPANRFAVDGAYLPSDLRQAYDYPSAAALLPDGRRLDGTGVHVANLMCEAADPADLALLLEADNFTAASGLPVPTFGVVNVDGGAPFNPNGDCSVEASLDTQQVLGGAPGVTLTQISLPELLDEHILAGLVTIDDLNRWDLVNMSFGLCEAVNTADYWANANLALKKDLDTHLIRVGQHLRDFPDTAHELFEQGTAQGITFVGASGDEGARDCPSAPYWFGLPATLVVAVDYPTSDPYVTAVGGGSLLTTPPNPPSLTSNYVRESATAFPYEGGAGPYGLPGEVFGAGGGRSVLWTRPAWQQWTATYNNGGNGRIVPDVGMNISGCETDETLDQCYNDAESTDFVAFAGLFYEIGGTSASSPEFVSALALKVETSGRLGAVGPFLWSMGHSQVTAGGAQAPVAFQFFHKGQPVDDGAYTNASSNGFDYAYGNGSPDVRRLLGLTAYPPAGDPQTPSNP